MHTLIVTSLNRQTGLINTDNFQYLDDWQLGNRDDDLINMRYGNELFDILKNDLNYITYNRERNEFMPTFMTYTSDDDVEIACMRLLGKIAEAVIVNSCRESFYQNRKWARYARRGKYIVKSLDKFIAIGTGLHSTFNSEYASKYNPSDTQRDILWVHRDHIKEEMKTITKNSYSAFLPAGLQIKVSRNGFASVLKKDIARSRYEVPIVYFDLCRDYYDLANAIYKNEKNIEIGTDIIRGSDIDAGIHDLLHSYYFLIKNILVGKYPIQSLLSYSSLTNKVMSTALEEQNKRKIILTV